jgi:hypothetical protein
MKHVPPASLSVARPPLPGGRERSSRPLIFDERGTPEREERSQTI